VNPENFSEYSLPKHMYSKHAPKGKGMLARVIEKDL
jgi:hypothetical protein